MRIEVVQVVQSVAMALVLYLAWTIRASFKAGQQFAALDHSKEFATIAKQFDEANERSSKVLSYVQGAEQRMRTELRADLAEYVRRDVLDVRFEESRLDRARLCADLSALRATIEKRS